MRLLFGFISKNGVDVISEIRKVFPNNSGDYEVLIFTENNLQKTDNFSEIDENNLKGNIGVGYFYQKKEGNDLLNLQYEKDDIGYFLLYGKTWDSRIPLIKNANFNDLDGNYILVQKKGPRIILSKDVVGIKQMYYGENNDFIGFSSRRRQLQALGINANRLLPGEILELTGRGVRKIGQRRLLRPVISIFEENVAIERYKESIISSVRKRAADVDRVGIVFSGGIDSSLIAQIADKLGKDVVCYCAGVPDSLDIKTAEESANSLGFPIKKFILTKDFIEALLPQVIRTIEDWNQLQVEAAIPVYCAIWSAAKDGIKVVFNGQGADELFAGYDWYPNVLQKEGEERLIEHMWEDLLLGYKETFERENKMAEFHNLELRVPYCDFDVIETAMSISIGLKTKDDDEMRKYVHRKVGEVLGVPLSISWREKDAAQHASGVHDVVKSIARENEYDENKTYELKTVIENLGSVYRYGNRYRTDQEEYGDSFVQAYLEDIALGLGMVGIIKKL